jgi:membrane protein YdbS with pleckstrin-like domain
MRVRDRISSVRVADLSPIADGADRQLDARMIPLQQTVGLILAACVAAGSFMTLSIVWLANNLGWSALGAFAALWALAGGALAWLTYRWPAIAYRHASYRVDAQGIEIRRGVYWRTIINVPRSRVQHTDVSQGPLERTYGLGTLVIYTAGTDHARIDLAGLDHATAFQIREHLLVPSRVDGIPSEDSDAV